MTLTLEFQGQIFNSYILGMDGRLTWDERDVS